MKILLLAFFLCLFVYKSDAQIPKLQKVGESTCLMVNNKPFVMYSGELHNSTCSSIDYMENNHIWDNLKEMNLNSVIATVSWELLEPVEGQYDFSHVDYMIEEARKRNLKIAFIWFGAWKNPFMTYAPGWVKKDPKRFPRAKDEDANDLELPSVFYESTMKVDTKAYIALMKHIQEIDPDYTVIMMQIQNEPGLRGAKRDYSEFANKNWKSDVPQQLIDYLSANKGKLQPDLEQAWAENGYKIKGNWEDVFGKSITGDDGSNRILHLTEHLFTAWSFAKYLDYMAKAGKEIHPVPTFINASVFGMNSRGRSLGNGCSIPEFFDIYRAGAPNIDIQTPNSYMQQLDWICAQYAWKGNPVLIPESTIYGARALYVIGEYDAIGFSPFAIDIYKEDRSENMMREAALLSQTYKALQSMNGLITSKLGSKQMRGAYIYPGRESDSFDLGDYTFTFTAKKGFDIGILMAPAGGNKAESAEQKPFQGGAIVIQTAKDEFYIVGYGINADIKLKEGIKSKYCGYDAIYEGHFEDDNFIPGRLLNGDERTVYISDQVVGVLKVNMYHY